MPDPVDTLEYSDCIIKRSDGELDARPLYDDMRMADMLECIGLGHHPRLAVESSYEHSTDSWSIWTPDYRMVGSFGVCPSSKKGVGIAWLLGTYRIHLIKKTFVRHSKQWINRLMGDYSCLTNLVCKENELSVRWLTWLGATWSDCGIDNYQQFTIYKQHLN